MIDPQPIDPTRLARFATSSYRVVALASDMGCGWRRPCSQVIFFFPGWSKQTYSSQFNLILALNQAEIQVKIILKKECKTHRLNLNIFKPKKKKKKKPLKPSLPPCLPLLSALYLPPCILIFEHHGMF